MELGAVAEFGQAVGVGFELFEAFQDAITTAIRERANQWEPSIADRLEEDGSNMIGLVEVQDDGPGLGNDAGAEERGTGVGLANVRSRILHLYGDEGAVELTSLPDRGALAKVVLPITFQMGVPDDE